jgi:acetylornithine deacetylase
MNKHYPTVEKYIDDNKNQAIGLLQKMIQQPSVQGNEKGVQEVVIKKLYELGLIVDVWDPSTQELSKSEYFVPSRNSFEGSPNVVGVLKGTGEGKSIIFNGHIDVVPEGDRSKWEDDPFSGKIKDGKMFGRGTTDMKGGNIALLFAIESIIKSGIKLKGDVIFQSVIEEESGGAGTLATLIRNYKADAAIIPEPTKMKLFMKQQGSMWFRVSVDGVAAHGGTRYEGISAIENAVKIHRAILDLEKKRNEKITDPLYSHIPIPLPINVGKIQGGSWPSSVPDLVTLEGRMGVGPEEEIKDVKKQLVDHLHDVCGSDSWLKDHPVKVEFFGAQWVPNGVEENHPFVSLLKENFNSVYDKSLTIEASPWGTDAGLLGKVGNIPALVIGPGETKMAHFPNEYIELKEVIKASKLFALTLLTWCDVNS